MQYHCNAKTNVKQRQIIKKSSESTRNLGNRFLVSQVTVVKWRKAEHLEDKSSRPKTIHYAFSKAECRIIVKVRKRDLFSLDDLYLSLKPYLRKLNRTNCYRTLLRYRLKKLSEKKKRERLIEKERTEPAINNLLKLYI